MAHGVGLEVQEQVNACMALARPMLTKVDQITETLLSKGFAWKADLKVNDILVEVELLVGSACFGASHEPAQKKDQQLALNKSLVKPSGGLAPLTGKERFMSVGTSHTCALFRLRKPIASRQRAAKARLPSKPVTSWTMDGTGWSSVAWWNPALSDGFERSRGKPETNE